MDGFDFALEYSRQAAHWGQPDLEIGERAFECVRRTDSYDLWLIHWGPGSATPMHDHGGSAGALFVVEGKLVEHTPARRRPGGVRRRTLRAPDRRLMAGSHVHAMANESPVSATSVHVYSPPLDVMHHYELGADAAARVVHRELIGPAREARPSLV